MSEVFAMNGVVIRDESGANPDTVKLLEDALTRAKNGDFEIVAIVFVDRSGSVDSAWSDGKGRLALIAGFEFAKRDIMAQE